MEECEKEGGEQGYVLLLQAVGEPPLFLAASVFFAIQNAIRAAREDAGESRTFAMDSPATCERIRMACVDHLTKQVREKLFPYCSYCGRYIGLAISSCLLAN